MAGAGAGSVPSPFQMPSVPLPSQSPSPLPSLSVARAPQLRVQVNVPAAHRHASLSLPVLREQTDLIIFKQADVPTVFNKLRTFITEEKVPAGPGHDQLGALEKGLADLSSKGGLGSLPIPPTLPGLVSHLMASLPTPKQFPVMDILRLVLLTEEGNAMYAQGGPSRDLARYIFAGNSPDPSKRAVQLLTLRAACNLFAWGTGRHHVLQQRAEGDILGAIIDAVVAGLHTNDRITRKVVASLCFDVALLLSSSQADMSDERLQLISALVNLKDVPGDRDEEVDLRHLQALATLMLGNDDMVLLATTLDIEAMLAMYSTSSSSRVALLAKEVTSLVA
eukprot:TRINITY_DN6522_c0_g1_i1.p1 TRINITY_DN6522_c0_g1~~TRINITY_DN6522_c0_g1_i1.p1  ORF type:complete len:395 (-),score=67.62 TRINITY_DN6522_c0_g1_i1:157-1164(-)